MAERGKGRKCADCANWKVKDSACTYYDEIVKGLIVKTDDACTDFILKEKKSLSYTNPVATQIKDHSKPSTTIKNQLFLF